MGKTIKTWFINGDKSWKITFYLSQIVSIFLIVVSFFIPPAGVIDSSVYGAIGELFCFPALYSFYNIIMSGKKATMQHGNTSITVNNETEVDV